MGSGMKSTNGRILSVVVERVRAVEGPETHPLFQRHSECATIEGQNPPLSISFGEGEVGERVHQRRYWLAGYKE